jgi:hypothetical protein
VLAKAARARAAPLLTRAVEELDETPAAV